MTLSVASQYGPHLMTRLIAAALQLGRPLLSLFVIATGALAFSAPGCSDDGIGDPCTPEQEYNSDFLGFDPKEVNLESKSFQCRTRLCLVNHFQGRVSCPYGQDTSGKGTNGGAACSVPGTQTADGGAGSPIVGAKDATGAFLATTGSTVEPQCLDRTANKAVYCSCRCADINGEKTGGSNYCAGPDGFSCQRLVTSIGTGNEGLTGSYCIKAGTDYVAGSSCNAGTGTCTSPNCNN